MAVYDEVSFDDWRDGAGCTMPDYTFSAPHKPQPQEKAAWPTDGVTLRYNAQTLEEAAEIFHTTVENLKELNPLAGQIQPRQRVLLGPESTGRPLHPAHEQCGDGHSQCTVGRELL